jgi:hypothetical protein
VRSIDRFKNSPFMVAAETGRRKNVEILLEKDKKMVLSKN